MDSICLYMLIQKKVDEKLENPTAVQWCVSCTLVLVHLHFNVVSSVLAPFQIGYLRWYEMMIELEQLY